MLPQKIRDRIAHSGCIFDFLQYQCPFVKKFTALKRELVLNEVKRMAGRGKEAKKVLDYGSATGHLSVLFAKEEYLGVDIEQKYIDFARRRYPDRQFMLVQEDTLPFAPDHFDLVLMLSTIHHIPDSQLPGLLSELRRILKDEGRLMIIDYPPSRFHKHPVVRFILHHDAGNFLRTRDTLEGILGEYFSIESFSEQRAGGYLVYCFKLVKK